MTGDARSVVLRRVRASLADVPASEPPERSAPPRDAPASGALADRFAERVEDYRARVTRCAPDLLADVVAEVCARHAARRLVVPAALPAAWRPPTVEALRDDPPLSVAELDQADGVLTGAALGIAETGTIVLDGGPRSGRRALTLVPDLHLCVVSAGALVGTVREAVAALAAAVAEGRPVTLVSGPSATSDIELERVVGVHGPRRLEVLLVDAPAEGRPVGE